MEVTAGLAESNDSLPQDGWLKVTCGLTACTPGSASGPTSMGKLYHFFTTSRDPGALYVDNNGVMSRFESVVENCQGVTYVA